MVISRMASEISAPVVEQPRRSSTNDEDHPTSANTLLPVEGEPSCAAKEENLETSGKDNPESNLLKTDAPHQEDKSQKEDAPGEPQSDKLDGVYLHRPPLHKQRPQPANTEEESCGLKCLYFVLLCCECSVS